MFSHSILQFWPCCKWRIFNVGEDTLLPFWPNYVISFNWPIAMSLFGFFLHSLREVLHLMAKVHLPFKGYQMSRITIVSTSKATRGRPYDDKRRVCTSPLSSITNRLKLVSLMRWDETFKNYKTRMLMKMETLSIYNHKNNETKTISDSTNISHGPQKSTNFNEEVTKVFPESLVVYSIQSWRELICAC